MMSKQRLSSECSVQNKAEVLVPAVSTVWRARLSMRTIWPSAFLATQQHEKEREGGRGGTERERESNIS